MKSRIAILLSVTLAVLVLVMGVVPKVIPTSPVLAQVMYQYSVPFKCGIAVDECKDGVKPANYATKIDIHNPNCMTVTIWWKVVKLYPAPATKTGFQEITINSDGGRIIRCLNIGGRLKLPCPLEIYINGFVVIQCSYQLDVYAEYTAELGLGGGLSMDVEHILPSEFVCLQ